MVKDAEIEKIFKEICLIMDVDFDDLFKNKSHHVALTRALCVFFSKKITGASLASLTRYTKQNPRTVRRQISRIKAGVLRESYYKTPYDMINKSMTTIYNFI